MTAKEQSVDNAKEIAVKLPLSNLYTFFLLNLLIEIQTVRPFPATNIDRLQGTVEHTGGIVILSQVAIEWSHINCECDQQKHQSVSQSLWLPLVGTFTLLQTFLFAHLARLFLLSPLLFVFLSAPFFD